MWTTEDQTVAVGHSVAVDPTHWQELFDELLGRVAGRFARVEPRRRAKAFVRGLLADLPPKNCWTIAEHVGDPALMGCSTCLVGRCGMRTRYAMTSAPTLWSIWAIPRRCWWWTRPATSRRAPEPLGCNARTPAPPGGSRTPRSPSTWCTPPMPGMG